MTFFIIFHLIMMKNNKNYKLLIQIIEFENFWFFYYPSKIAISPVLRLKNHNISGCSWWISVLRPDLESWLNSDKMLLSQYFDLTTKTLSKMPLKWREGEKIVCCHQLKIQFSKISCKIDVFRSVVIASSRINPKRANAFWDVRNFGIFH